MLTKFQVKNFKKFNDNLVFDLSKKGDYDFNEEVIRNNIEICRNFVEINFLNK